jgi:site-specific DNA-cytosine methylase
MKLRVLDLFSGIGGFSLGLERTGGFETVAFCEFEPFCQKVLNKRQTGRTEYSDGDYGRRGRQENGESILEPGLGRVAHGLPRWLDEPGDVPRVSPAGKDRNARLKALGNSVVPQIPEMIGRAILAAEGK